MNARMKFDVMPDLYELKDSDGEYKYMEIGVTINNASLDTCADIIRELTKSVNLEFEAVANGCVDWNEAREGYESSYFESIMVERDCLTKRELWKGLSKKLQSAKKEVLAGLKTK